ncbi:hypothetical protein OE88DRAFT_300255 [Heliocybe sulcata]|uniref:Uncharacterized protein n=1 Tax=Heliocybe sulcata TaxID=5364 RepID=A0A5C3MXQ0_9AGAM|nr:hypothetical protein OE88DRAFT_300255 [Heliocybe sulcata]
MLGEVHARTRLRLLLLEQRWEVVLYRDRPQGRSSNRRAEDFAARAHHVFCYGGHEDPVIGRSPDGKLLATSASVCLWNPLEGKNIRVLVGATNQSWTAPFSGALP